MAKQRTLEGMSTAEIERVLQARRREAGKLRKKRTKLRQQLDALDRRIAMLDGSRAGGGTGRVRNEHSLVETMRMILGKSGKPMRVGEILQGVVRSGYRTTSDNFRGIVNQTLIKEKQFASAGRGLYQLKK